MSDINFDIIHGTESVAEGFLKCNKNFLKVNDTISKGAIANNLTTTEEGKVLDARQGKVLNDKIEVLSTNALKYKGHFNGDLNTLIGIDKAGIYALQHQCTHTPNDTDNYAFERGILIVNSDGVSVTHELTAVHIGYPTYVGKHYKRTGWVGSDWTRWRCNDDEKLNKQGVTEKESNLISPSQFQYLLYSYSEGNFAGIGVGANGAINIRAGTSNELATYLKIPGGGIATINDKKIVVSDEITALQGKLGIPFATWLDNPDFNTLTTFNRYRIGGGTNSPDSNSVWYLEVNPVQEGIVYQKAKCIYGGSLGKKYERVLKDGSWTNWVLMTTTETGTITIKPDLGITPIFITPKVTISGNTFTISGGLKLTKPLVEGTVVMNLPTGMYPQFPYHIFFNSWNYAIPTSCRLWVQTDGNISIHSASQFPTQEIDLDFSRTVTF